MVAGSKRYAVIAVVAVHVLLVLAYTLPSQWIPDRLGALARSYVRPVFHQQWFLFAPDPPLCACDIQARLPDGSWRPMMSDEDHWLKRRMARPLADHVAQGLAQGDTVVAPVLAQAMRSASRDIRREVKGIQFRLVEQCVTDPAHPEMRVERITPLQLSAP